MKHVQHSLPASPRCHRPARTASCLPSSSLYFTVRLSLTRSSVRLQSPDFLNPKKAMTFAQKKKKKMHIKIPMEVSMQFAGGPSTSKSMDTDTWLITLPYMFASPPIHFESFLFIHFAHSFFLCNTYAVLHCADSRKVHAFEEVSFLHVLSRCFMPLPV